MKTKRAGHTPGPWSLLEDNSFVVCAQSGKPIAEAIGVNCHESGIGAGSIQAANARLIAAAPDLLRALKLLVVLRDRDDVYDTFKREIDLAEKVIVRAEGRQP